MKRSAVLGVVAGLAVSGSALGDFTCSVSNNWLWFGEISDEFLLSANWFDCGGLIGPVPDSTLPVYMGPWRTTVNGVPGAIQFPLNDALLTSDFISPGLRIANGVDYTFTVRNAVYTCSSGVIGDAAPFPALAGIGISTLLLDNAEWRGSLTIGANGGRGHLITRGVSMVTGNTTLGPSGSIDNSGDLVLGVNTSFGFASNLSVINRAGSRLFIENTVTGSLPFRGAGSRLVLEPGSTLVKTGNTASTTIEWDVENEGAIAIESGGLAFLGDYVGDGSLLLDGASLVIPNIEFSSSGLVVDSLSQSTLSLTGTTFLGMGAEFPIELSGPMSVLMSNVTSDKTVVFRFDGDLSYSGAPPESTALEGFIRLLNRSFDTVDDRVFVIRDGGVLTLENTVTGSLPFRGAGSRLVLEPGSTLVKTGNTASTTIEWDVHNEGTIDIREGALSISTTKQQITAETSVLAGNGSLTFTQADGLLNKGTLAPGLATDADPDGLRIDVDFLQNADTAVFRVQAGIEAGKLTVPGVFDVGGTLEVVRFGDFEPDGTEEFTVIEAGFVSGVFGDFFDNAVPVQGLVAQDVVTGDLKFDVEYTDTSVVIRNLSIFVPPCNLADLADPAGILDLADTDAFITLFLAGDPSVDLVPTFGVIDLADIDAFVLEFLAGCP